MSTVARFSIEEYDRLVATGAFDGENARRIELIHGELRDITPIGVQHEIAVDKLTEWSFESLPKKKVWVRVQNSVGVPEFDSAPQPDIAWVARRDYRKGRPKGSDVLLIIEVADSSLAFDRGEKAAIYAAARVKDYWIVNLINRYVEVYRNPLRGRYSSVRTYGNGEEIAALAFPKVKLSVSLIF